MSRWKAIINTWIISHQSLLYRTFQFNSSSRITSRW